MATREEVIAEIQRRKVKAELEARGETDHQGFVGAGFIEPALAAVSGMAGEVAGGVAGLVQSINPFEDEGAGAEAVSEVREALTFKPRTEAGKEGLKTLGDLVKQGVDMANFPISGLAGLAKLASSGSIDEAVGTVENVQEQGAGKSAGEAVQEATGSPVLATLAETALSGAADIAALKGVGSGAKAAAVSTGVNKIVIPQSATKQKIAEMIKEGSTDVETAEFKMVEGSDVPLNRIQKFLKIGGPRIQKDPKAIETLTQGFDPGVIAAVKGSTLADKAKMLRMTNIMEKGKRNARFGVLNRPGDVVGDSLLSRIEAVKLANKHAGRDLERVVSDMKAEASPATIDVTAAGANFQKNLDDLGITLDANKKPDFSNSDIEGLAGPTKAIERIVNRLAKMKSPTAANLHQLKKQIDETVTFGKSAEGLGGKVERSLKTLRHDINKAIGDKVPEYARANKAFSETINAIDDIQSASGKKINLDSPSAKKAAGVVLRRLMGNAASRANLIDSINKIEGVANKYGRLKKNSSGELLLERPGGSSPLFPDDIVTQALFADELDSVFGPAARTSFQGQIGQAVDRTARAAQAIKEGGAISAGISGAGAVSDKLKGINQENAFKSMREFLKD